MAKIYDYALIRNKLTVRSWKYNLSAKKSNAMLKFSEWSETDISRLMEVSNENWKLQRTMYPVRYKYNTP